MTNVHWNGARGQIALLWNIQFAWHIWVKGATWWNSLVATANEQATKNFCMSFRMFAARARARPSHNLITSNRKYGVWFLVKVWCCEDAYHQPVAGSWRRHIPVNDVTSNHGTHESIRRVQPSRISRTKLLRWRPRANRLHTMTPLWFFFFFRVQKFNRIKMFQQKWW